MLPCLYSYVHDRSMVFRDFHYLGHSRPDHEKRRHRETSPNTAHSDQVHMANTTARTIEDASNRALNPCKRTATPRDWRGCFRITAQSVAGGWQLAVNQVELHLAHTIVGLSIIGVTRSRLIPDQTNYTSPSMAILSPRLPSSMKADKELIVYSPNRFHR